MELQQHHAPFRLAERLVEIIESVLSGSDDVDDLRDELEELRVWIGLDRFDRRGAKPRLAALFPARRRAWGARYKRGTRGGTRHKRRGTWGAEPRGAAAPGRGGLVRGQK